jgi:hypothetical protein
MLYKERQMALNLEEPYIFIDGPIFSEKLLKNHEMQDVYQKMYPNTGTVKRYIGIIKDISENNELNSVASTLKKGDVSIVETFYNTLKNKDLNNNLDVDLSEILRGVFKIGNKAYGFEVHENDLKFMIKLIFNECSADSHSYELPFILKIIDKSIKRFNLNDQWNESIKSKIISSQDTVDSQLNAINLLKK